MPSTTFAGVKWRVADNVGYLTLDLPETRNAMTEDLQTGIAECLTYLEERQDIRVLVLSASGRSFSSGGDLALMADLPDMKAEDAVQRLSSIYPPFLKLLRFPCPTIAAINGPAVGGGLGIAALCDIRIAGESARFAAPFGQVGLPPGMGLTVLLPELVGYARAMELLLTGRSIDAVEARDIGLVSEVVEDDVLQARATQLAAELSKQAPGVAREVVTRLRGPLRRRVEEALEGELMSQAIAVRTGEYRDRVDRMIQRLAERTE